MDTYNKLLEILPKEYIYTDEPMSKHTTFKIGGLADFFVTPTESEQIKKIIIFSKQNNIPLTIIGNGSNILVKDSGIRGITIKPKIENIQIEDDFIIAGAGVNLTKLSKVAMLNSLHGLEFAYGIPGCVGGAIKMNSGAHELEMKDVVYETSYIDYDGNIKNINNEEHKFEYRKTRFFDEKAIILETKLKLVKGNKEEIKEKMDEYMKIRREKQPLEYPSAGSVFKRGKDFISAKLIDDAGLKGTRIGGAEVSKKHAGFIINVNNASYSDVINLINYIKEEIYKKFKVNIEEEIQII